MVAHISLAALRVPRVVLAWPMGSRMESRGGATDWGGRAIIWVVSEARTAEGASSGKHCVARVTHVFVERVCARTEYTRNGHHQDDGRPTDDDGTHAAGGAHA